MLRVDKENQRLSRKRESKCYLIVKDGHQACLHICAFNLQNNKYLTEQYITEYGRI
jgi:hypothetical protein